jgi:hypothetical protein
VSAADQQGEEEMRNWVAGVMLVLGALLVIGGAVVLVLKAQLNGPGQPGVDGQTTAERPAVPVAERARRIGAAIARLGEGHRLIAWGVLLLVLAAVAAGAVGFNLNAQTGTS